SKSRYRQEALGNLQGILRNKPGTDRFSARGTSATAAGPGGIPVRLPARFILEEMFFYKRGNVLLPTPRADTPVVSTRPWVESYSSTGPRVHYGAAPDPPSGPGVPSRDLASPRIADGHIPVNAACPRVDAAVDNYLSVSGNGGCKNQEN